MRIRNTTLAEIIDAMTGSLTYRRSPERDEPSPYTLHLNAYELDRCYGGPEEGGWWYDAGDPIASIPFHNEKELADAIRLLYNYYAQQVAEGRPYTSVLGGFDIALSMEDTFAKAYPTEVPTYA